MRLFAVSLFALSLASPAWADDRASDRPGRDAAQVGAMLSNPLVQDSVAATIDQFVDALMQTRVGALAHYADPRADVRPDDTLGDVTERAHPRYRADLRNRTRGALAATGQAASDLAGLTNEFQRTIERMQNVIDRTQAQIDTAP